MEALGGQGYMEDATEIPRLLRDSTVNLIWKGTASVLAMDVVRVFTKDPSHFLVFRNVR